MASLIAREPNKMEQNATKTGAFTYKTCVKHNYMKSFRYKLPKKSERSEKNSREINSGLENSSYPRMVTPISVCDDGKHKCETEDTTENKSEMSVNASESEDEDDSTVYSSSSSGDYSSCSSVIPIVRPLARRAPLPNPEICIQSLSNRDDPPNNKSNSHYSRFGSNFSGFSSPNINCKSNNLHSSFEADDESSKSSLRNMKSMMNLNEIRAPERNDQDFVRPLCGIMDCYGAICCESGNFVPNDSFSKYDTIDSSSISQGTIKDSTELYKNTHMGKESKTSSRQDQELANRSSWWIRRQARLKCKRRRRTSPVFDNMPVVPESPTVLTVSSEESGSDDSPRPMSPPRTALHKRIINDVKNSRHDGSYTSGYTVSPSIYIHPSTTERISSIRGSISEGRSKRNNQEMKIPTIVTCKDSEDDSYSISSWVSHSNLRSDYSASSQCRRGTSDNIPGSSSKSTSSGSLSLPVFIAPAYKFTPIDRNQSHDNSDAGSYEKPHNMYYGASNIEYQAPNHRKSYESEEWSVFDMPLLLSKTICDWAAGSKV